MGVPKAAKKPLKLVLSFSLKLILLMNNNVKLNFDLIYQICREFKFVEHFGIIGHVA